MQHQFDANACLACFPPRYDICLPHSFNFPMLSEILKPITLTESYTALCSEEGGEVYAVLNFIAIAFVTDDNWYCSHAFVSMSWVRLFEYKYYCQIVYLLYVPRQYAHENATESNLCSRNHATTHVIFTKNDCLPSSKATESACCGLGQSIDNLCLQMSLWTMIAFVAHYRFSRTFVDHCIYAWQAAGDVDMMNPMTQVTQ